MLRYYHDFLRPPINIRNKISERAARLPFNFHSAGKWMVGKEYYVRRDQRYDFYLLYTVSGTGFMNYKEETYSLTEGTVILIDCMEYQHYGTVDDWEHVWFHINGSGVKDFYQLLNSPKVGPVMLADDAAVTELFRTLEKNSDKQNLKNEMEIAYAIMKLLGVILEKKQSAEADIPIPVPDWYHELNHYIYLSRHKVITVFDLAKKYNIPVMELEHIYKLHAGKELAEVMREAHEDYIGTKGVQCNNPEWLFECINYIQENFTTKISLDELIKKYNIGRSTFMSKFKQYAAMSPLQYIIKLRIEHAKTLLEKTNNTVSSIAYDCNFASSSDFPKKFKELTGVTPNEYRRGK